MTEMINKILIFLTLNLSFISAQINGKSIAILDFNGNGINKMESIVLTNIFNVTEVITGKNIYTVTLSPKEAKSDLNRLILRTNKNNYQITGVTVYDELGNKTQIKFRNIRINEQIAESNFDFRVPAGVETQDFTPNP